MPPSGLPPQPPGHATRQTRASSAHVAAWALEGGHALPRSASAGSGPGGGGSYFRSGGGSPSLNAAAAALAERLSERQAMAELLAALRPVCSRCGGGGAAAAGGGSAGSQSGSAASGAVGGGRDGVGAGVGVGGVRAVKDIEGLAEELRAARAALAESQDQNRLLRTERQRLEAELGRCRTNLVKAEELLGQREKALSPNTGLSRLYRSSGTTALVGKLREQLAAQAAQAEGLRGQLEELMRSSRATQVAELRAELRAARQELARQVELAGALRGRLAEEQQRTAEALERGEAAERLATLLRHLSEEQRRQTREAAQQAALARRLDEEVRRRDEGPAPEAAPSAAAAAAPPPPEAAPAEGRPPAAAPAAANAARAERPHPGQARQGERAQGQASQARDGASGATGATGDGSAAAGTAEEAAPAAEPPTAQGAVAGGGGAAAGAGGGSASASGGERPQARADAAASTASGSGSPPAPAAAAATGTAGPVAGAARGSEASPSPSPRASAAASLAAAGPAALSSGRVKATMAALGEAHRTLLSQATLLSELFPPGLTAEQLLLRAALRPATSGAPEVLRYLRHHTHQLVEAMSGLPGSRLVMVTEEGAGGAGGAAARSGARNSPARASRASPGRIGRAGAAATRGRFGSGHGGGAPSPKSNGGGGSFGGGFGGGVSASGEVDPWALVNEMLECVRWLRTLDQASLQSRPDVSGTVEQMVGLVRLLEAETRRLLGDEGLQEWGSWGGAAGQTSEPGQA